MNLWAIQDPFEGNEERLWFALPVLTDSSQADQMWVAEQSGWAPGAEGSSPSRLVHVPLERAEALFVPLQGGLEVASGDVLLVMGPEFKQKLDSLATDLPKAELSWLTGAGSCPLSPVDGPGVHEMRQKPFWFMSVPYEAAHRKVEGLGLWLLGYADRLVQEGTQVARSLAARVLECVYHLPGPLTEELVLRRLVVETGERSARFRAYAQERWGLTPEALDLELARWKDEQGVRATGVGDLVGDIAAGVVSEFTDKGSAPENVQYKGAKRSTEGVVKKVPKPSATQLLVA